MRHDEHQRDIRKTIILILLVEFERDRSPLLDMSIHKNLKIMQLYNQTVYLDLYL